MRWTRVDLAVVLVLVLCSAAASWLASTQFDQRFFKDPDGNDAWFEADLPTVSDRILHRWSDQSRNARHPLFPLLATLPANAAKPVTGERAALRLLVAAFAALWSAVLYVLLRGITPARADALIFTALAHVSAASVFWLSVPETYALGSVSVIAALALCAWDPPGRLGSIAYVAAASFSLAVTTTNWVSGLSALLSRKPIRQAIQLAANSLTVVVLLWGAQRLLFPTADFFIGAGAQSRFILPHGLDGIAASLRAALFHAIVMPAIAIVPEPKWGPIMSVQASGLGSGGPLAIAATLLWAALLAAGVWAAAIRPTAIRLPLVLSLAGHLAVYAVYGEETFLYTLHIAPLLVSVAALTTSWTPLRRPALVAAVVLAVLLALHNVQSLRTALEFFASGNR